MSEDPSLFCEKCFKALHYKDNQKACVHSVLINTLAIIIGNLGEWTGDIVFKRSSSTKLYLFYMHFLYVCNYMDWK